LEYRVNLGKVAPKLYQSMISFDKQVNEHVASSGIEEGFSHLLRLRASQLNGCAFCVRLHTRDALASGESMDRISVLPAWRETQHFNSKERASLALCEAVTSISDGQIPDSVYQYAKSALSSEEISAVQWLAVLINAWNRVAISSRYPVSDAS